MGLKIKSEHLNGLLVFEPQVIQDERGFFMESFKASEFEQFRLPVNYVQDNHSRSLKNVLRGMHFQWDKPQGKLIRVTVGSALVVEVDIRHNSSTLGNNFSIELSAENMNILWVPPGFANGFLALSDYVEMQYKCTAEWNRDGEGSIRWNDPQLNIQWNVDKPVISDKDNSAPTLNEWLSKEESKLFRV